MNLDARMIIDLDVFHHNVTTILKETEASVLFVLKGNAYGHGYRVIAQELAGYERIVFLGVATPQEAMYLQPFTSKPIVVLGYTHTPQLNDLVQRGIIPTIFTYEQARHIHVSGSVFLNVDTGFHRLGQPISEQYRSDILAIQAMSHLNVLGVFTHLALRDKHVDEGRIQSFLTWVEAFRIPYLSISDSIAFVRYNTTENLFRMGALMFGLQSERDSHRLDVIPTTKLIATVTRVQQISQACEVFYRAQVAANRTIATVQIGYGDGLFRTMAEDAYALIGGISCKYIEVGMDQTLFDVTGGNVQVGDEVVIFDAHNLPLSTFASWCNTNKNNVLVNMSHRVQRQYWRQGRLVATEGLGGYQNEQ